MKAVIFDLDGTLVDSLRDLAESMNAVLCRHGYAQHPVDAYKTFIGDGVAMLVRRALPDVGECAQGLSRCVQQLAEVYRANCLRNTVAYPGVPLMLDMLRRRGFRLAVLSNKPDPLTKFMVAELFPEGVFDYVLGAVDGIPRKPEATGALRVAEAIGCRAGDCAYVGDSGTDMATAVNAGMLPLGVLWGFRARDELVAAGARHLFATPARLADFLHSGGPGR